MTEIMRAQMDGRDPVIGEPPAPEGAEEVPEDRKNRALLAAIRNEQVKTRHAAEACAEAAGKLVEGLRAIYTLLDGKEK